MVKNLPADAGFDHWLGKISRGRKCHLTAVFLPGKIPWTEGTW